MDKRGEHHVELREAGADPTTALQGTEQPLDLVAPLADRLALVPDREPIGLRRHHRGEAQVEGQLPGVVALVGAPSMIRCMRRFGPPSEAESFRPSGASCAYQGELGHRFRGDDTNWVIPAQRAASTHVQAAVAAEIGTGGEA